MSTPNQSRFSIGVFALLLTAGAQAVCATPSHTDTIWPEYNDGYNSQRFSPLKQRNTRNVADLNSLYACGIV